MRWVLWLGCFGVLSASAAVLTRDDLDVLRPIRCLPCQAPLSIVDSDHPFALALREVSVQRLREGMTVEALRRELEDRYGPEIWQDLPRDTPAASMWLMGGSVVLMLALVRWLTVHPWR